MTEKRLAGGEKLRQFFTVRNSLLTIGGLGTGLLLWLILTFWVNAYNQRVDAGHLMRSNAIADALLSSAYDLAMERGLAYAALLSPDQANNAFRTEIAQVRRDSDERFSFALDTLRARAYELTSTATIDNAAVRFATFRSLRTSVDQQLRKRRSNRNPRITDAWLTDSTEMIEAIHRLVHASRYRATSSVRQIEALEDLKFAVSVMGEFAAREQALIAGKVAAAEWISDSELKTLSGYRGQLQQAWGRVEAYALESVALPEIVAKVEQIRQGFFDAFERLQAPIVNAGVQGQSYPLTTQQWFVQSNAALNPIRHLGEVTGAIASKLAKDQEAHGTRKLISDTIILILVVVLAMVASWIIVGWIVRPLERITKAMTALASGEDDVAVTATNQRGEIGEMARAVQVFKEKSEARNLEISRANAALKRLNEDLESRVEQRTAELASARDEAVRSNQAKSQFLANMSHELRTPMNAIIGFTRLVMRRGKKELPQQQYGNLEKILLSANHLLALINDVLDLSKIEAGHMEIRQGTFDLGLLLDLCLRTVEPTIGNKAVALRKGEIDELPAIISDQDKLKQILINLLSNAVKFTSEGDVVIDAKRQGNAVSISVRDSGIGIPEEAQSLIFEEFRQVDSSSTRQYGGTGLGLSITRHLVHLIGGDITVKSLPGQGSTFTVTIPLRLDSKDLSSIDHSNALEGAVNGTHPVILAIDDDPNAIYILRENLEDAGYHVVGATSSVDGLAKARCLEPLAITLDILMPDKDGWEVLSELKSDKRTKHIPVILLSIVDEKDLGYQLGAADYLLKPFDHDAILHAIERHLPANGRLLVIDDDPMVVDLISQLLSEESYEIKAAPDGQTGLDTTARWRPDVILLDLMMPGLDGFGVLTALKQEPSLAEIPVLVLTAKELSENEVEALQDGTVGLVPKQGLDRQALLAAIRRAQTIGTARRSRDNGAPNLTA